MRGIVILYIILMMFILGCKEIVPSTPTINSFMLGDVVCYKLGGVKGIIIYKNTGFPGYYEVRFLRPKNDVRIENNIAIGGGGLLAGGDVPIENGGGHFYKLEIHANEVEHCK